MTAARDWEPSCTICGRLRSRCLDLHIFETERGLPDPHDFESARSSSRLRSTGRPSRASDPMATNGSGATP